MTERTGSTKPVAVIVLGADAVLSARPATPVQLWHACLALGYDLAVPATWGDELIAAEALRALTTHPATVAMVCSCPMVARTLADVRADVAPHLVSLVAPPVATARYLRRVYGERRVHVSYAGSCPAAGDSAIDTWITPSELLGRFAASQVVLADQPELFESTLPPDRRRSLSQPGGLPTSERVGSIVRPRRIHTINELDTSAAIERGLASEVRTLLDIAPRAGCACSGMVPGMAESEARMAVIAVEPPHSARPVMADPGGLALIRRAPPARPRAVEPQVASPAPAARAQMALAEERRAASPATRRPTHSPLSWNLRERAHPQPTITTRPGDAPAATRAASPPRPTSLPVAQSAQQPLASRATPPAGYWFVAPPGTGEVVSDVEVERQRPSREFEAVSEVERDAPIGRNSPEPHAATLPEATAATQEAPALPSESPAESAANRSPLLPEPLPEPEPLATNGSDVPPSVPAGDDPAVASALASPEAGGAQEPGSTQSTLMSIGLGVLMAALFLLGRSPFDRR